MEKRSSILMLCYYYPPIRASGTTRSVAFSENLRALGWDVTVLSVKNAKDPWTRTGDQKPPEGINVIRTSEANLSKLVDTLHWLHCRAASIFGKELSTNYFREVLCLPDAQISWFKLAAALRHAKRNDIIYASCSPFSSAIAACIAGAVTRKPVVLDFRDAWTLNPHIQHIAFHQRCIEFLERRLAASCDRLILNSPGAKRLYEKRYPQLAAKFESIPNGFDYLDPAPSAQTEPFSVVHAGSFYGSRNARTVLEALAELSLPGVEFVQIGPDLPEYDEFKDKLSIRLTGSVPRHEALALMKKASLLYLKQGFEDGVTDYIAVAAKTYEYIATGLPVLADVPPGDNADVVSNYAANSYVVTSGKKEDLKQALQEAYSKRQSVTPNIRPEFIEAFDRKNLSRKLDALLRKVISERAAQ